MLTERISAICAKLWSTTLGDERIRIAVLDGPVDRSHSTFGEAKLIEIKEYVGPKGVLHGVASEHGTYVASIIFGQQKGAVEGIAPGCTGLLIPIFGNAADGGVSNCTQMELAHAIMAAADHGAHIVNISGGAFSPSGSTQPALTSALNWCETKGVLVVAAVGNDGCECLHIPASHPSILAVGAATASGGPLELSNWGAEYQGHGLLAFGENVRGAAPGGNVVERSGTSAATAVVSGVAGLLMSLELKRGRAPSGPRVRKLLLESSDPCPSVAPATCRRFLSGVLNVERAVSLLTKKDNKMSLDQPFGPTQSISIDANSEPRAGLSHNSLSPLLPTSGETPVKSCDLVPAATTVSPSSASLAPSGCGCGGDTARARRLVFVLGQVGFEFSSLARRDSIWQHMHKDDKNPPNPYDFAEFFGYLDDNPWDATSVIWTLKIESVPVYAISVGGPNSAHIVKHLRDFVVGQSKYEANRKKRGAQTEDAVERVSIAGVLGGSITLMTGEEVPVIHPEIRGMAGWNTPTFAKTVAQIKTPESQPPSRPNAKQRSDKQEVIQGFLERLYFEFRNVGLSPPDRAINYVGTNPHGFARAFTDAAEHQMELHTIEVVRSLTCRAGSDCWDVRLEFFYPEHNSAASRRVHRVTVDVSDIVPVTVGEEHFWPSAD